MIEKRLFGRLGDGSNVLLYIIRNRSGAEVKVMDFGATVVSLSMPDWSGKFSDIVTGYDSLDGYVNDKSFFGVIVGRYGNRIGKGKFTLDNKEYQVTKNEGDNHLHGGVKGFYKVLWKSEPMESDAGSGVKLNYTSPDGEEGYPGTVNIQVIYVLTNNNELSIQYIATTDKPTVINPTHHSYFNLSGNFENTILDHILIIDADTFTAVDSASIPTGKLMRVENTPMDFRQPTRIGDRIDDDFDQLRFGKGYDHNWVVNNYDGTVRKVATLHDPQSGRVMELLTDQPGVQFYSGNSMNGAIKGKNGVFYKKRSGLCLETQHFPDSPNKINFPSTRLNPGETYKQTTIHRFSVK